MLRASLILIQTGCASRRSPPVDSVAILTSTYRVAVYDAGVDAFRAKRYGLARRYWERAIELGDQDACSNLGYLLYYGFGGPPDLAAAFSHAVAAKRLANAAGAADAAVARDADALISKLRPRLSPAVEDSARSRGERWARLDPAP